MIWGVKPNMEMATFSQEVSVAPTLPLDLLRTVCEPQFEQMCYRIQADMPAGKVVSRDELRVMCEPYFEEMINAMQQTIQQQQTQGTQIVSQSNTCFKPGFYQSTQYFHHDVDNSTEADECAFGSLLAGIPSSEGECCDAAESKSENSDVERSIMVCRHWKSKGFCRLESKCKFLHPEGKCGVSAPRGCDGVSTPSEILDSDGMPMLMPAARKKKRGGKNRSSKPALL